MDTTTEAPSAPSDDFILADAIRLLERDHARVTAGYSWGTFFRHTLIRRRPQCCMHGALFFSDEGKRELRSAEAAIGGASLIHHSTRPFARGRVKRAYAQALEAARAATKSEG
jgi:hypothetical protein